MKNQITVNGYYTGQVFNLEIEKGKSIRLTGTYLNWSTPRPFDITFEIGSEVVVGSWNLIYTGKITKISENTISVQTRSGERRRFKFREFCEMNWNYSSEHVLRHNKEESYFI